MKKIITVLLSLALALTLAACDSSKTVKTTTKEDTAKLVHEFYDGLEKEENYKLTTMLNDAVSYTVKVNGNKLYMEDVMNNLKFYAFEENGKYYYIGEDGELREDSFSYPMYKDSLKTGLAMFVTGIMDVDDGGTLKYNAEQNEKDGVTNLVFTVTQGEGDEKAEITVTGNKKDGKVTDFTATSKSASSEMVMKYLLDYTDYEVTLPEYEIIDYSKYYKHVDTEYATIEEAMDAMGGSENAMIYNYGDVVLLFGEKDGKHYQYMASIDEETAKQVEALDDMADDYWDKCVELYKKLNVTDCVDFTDAVMTKEQTDSYVGKKVSDLIAEKFENTGWAIGGDEAHVYMAKGGMEYFLGVELPEGYTEETEVESEFFNDCTILSMDFNAPTMDVMPLGQ